MNSSTEAETLISIIVPIYNTPVLDLARCLRSLVNQTYPYWEAILIDDGSDNEEVRTYLETFASANERFRYYRYENGGPARARAFGIKHAIGTYIAFCDSDDELTENFLEDAISFCVDNDLDVVCGGVQRELGNSVVSYNSSFGNDGFRVFSGSDVEDLLDYSITNLRTKETKELGNAMIGRFFGKLYLAEKVRETPMDLDLRMSEDNMFSFELFKRCMRVGVTDHYWYLNHANNYSLTGRPARLDDLTDQRSFAMAVNRFAQDANDRISNSCYIRLLEIISTMLGILARVDSGNPTRKHTYEILQIREIHAAKFADFSNYLNSPGKLRLIKLAIAMPPHLGCMFMAGFVRLYTIRNSQVAAQHT